MKQKVKDNKAAVDTAGVDPQVAPVIPGEAVKEDPSSEEQEKKNKMKKNIAKDQKKPVQEIPDYADEVLKVFCGYEQLYIDNKGGVYTIGTDPSLIEGCVLYNNPYYNK